MLHSSLNIVGEKDNTDTTVLVTGVTGYLAGHVVNTLLRKNYKVKGTVRSLKNEEKNKTVYEICPEKNANLELVEANLLDNECWEGIM